MRFAFNLGNAVQIFVFVAILGPIFLGLFQNVVSVFGQKAYLDIAGLSANPMALLSVPGLSTAVPISLSTGILATVISL